jgi:hypothetical protein
MKITRHESFPMPLKAENRTETVSANFCTTVAVLAVVMPGISKKKCKVIPVLN